MSPQVHLRPSAAVETNRVEERAVLFHRDSGEALVLNPSASILWARLESEAGTVEDLADVLRDQFGLPNEQARRDAAELVDQLRDGDWLVVD